MACVPSAGPVGAVGGALQTHIPSSPRDFVGRRPPTSLTARRGALQSMEWHRPLRGLGAFPLSVKAAAHPFLTPGFRLRRHPCPAARGFANRQKKVRAQASLARTLLSICGEEGIRTPGTRKRTPVFEAGSFNHSDTSPFGTANLRLNFQFAIFWGST